MTIKWGVTLFGLLVIGFPIITWPQQNLFNVPSADITVENKFFVQQQFNFSSASGSSNTTLDYGLGNNLEVGINLFNVDMYSTTGVLPNPDFLLNFQKAIDINDNYKVSFGTQTGITPPLHNHVVQVPSFSYVMNAVDLKNQGKYYLGGYYANQAYAGAGDSFGLMAGVDFPLYEKVHLMGDLLSGNNSISVAVLGIVFYLPSNWQLSVGTQLPAPSSGNDYGMVFEITKL